jgi:hypothetical protein
MALKILLLWMSCAYTQALPHSMTEQLFDELVMTTSKNAFIHFYTTDCLSCRDIESNVWQKLGIKYYKSSHLVIGNMNCDEYNILCSNLGIGSFPSLSYFRHGQQPLPYNDEISFLQVDKFIRNQTSVSACSISEKFHCTEKQILLINEMTKYPSRIPKGVSRWKDSIVALKSDIAGHTSMCHDREKELQLNIEELQVKVNLATQIATQKQEKEEL